MAVVAAAGLEPSFFCVVHGIFRCRIVVMFLLLLSLLEAYLEVY